MDGVELLKRVKSKPEYQKLPIFVMSGGSQYSKEQILSLGENIYFTGKTRADYDWVYSEIKKLKQLTS